MSQAPKTKTETQNQLAVAPKLSAVEKAVRATLNTIDGEGRLWTLFEKYRDIQKTELTQHIQCRYDQGRILNAAERIDARAPRTFAEATNQSRSMIREMQLVALRVEPVEIVTFIDRASKVLSDPDKEKRSVSMGWSHLCELASIEDPKIRVRMMGRIISEGLSVDGLRQVLRDDGVKLYDYGSREGAGRTFELPKDPVGIMSRVSRQSSSFHRLIEQALFDKFERAVLDTPPDAIGKDGLAKLEAGYAEIAELSTMIEGRLGDISRIIDEVRNAVRSNERIVSLEAEKPKARVRIPAPGSAPIPSKSPVVPKTKK